MGYIFNPFTGNFDAVDQGGTFWGSPVADLTTLNLISTDTDGTCRLVLSTNDVYRWNVSSVAWQYVGKVKTGSFGSSPNNNGFLLGSDNTLTLEPADATHPGAVSTTTQSFGGNKTFTGTLAASNLSGTNTGDVTLASVGSSPAAAGASLSGQQLTLQPADATHPGVLTSGAQTIGGVKTFNSSINADGGIDLTEVGASDTLNIGTANADIINIGNSGATINMQGTTLYQNVTNLQVADKLITINKGGSAGSAVSSGMEIEEGGSITGYSETSGDRNSWLFKAPNTAGIATVTPGASGITLNQSSHDPVTIATVGSSPNSSGASLSTQAITLQPADGTNPGLITAGTQTIGGAKTFSGSISASNLSGTNTGDVTLGAVGSTPNANGASLSGQALTFQPANASFPGVVTTVSQSFAGAKTFTTSVDINNTSGANLLVYTAAASVNYSIVFAGETAVKGFGLRYSGSSHRCEIFKTISSLGGGTTLFYSDNGSTAPYVGMGSVTGPGAILDVAASAIGNIGLRVTAISSQTANLQEWRDVSNITQSSISPTGDATLASATLSNTTATTVPYLDSAKKLVSSAVTPTELGYVSGVTSAIQTQLSSKLAKATGDINETSFSASNNQASAADVTSFAFSNAGVRSFDALVSVYVNATSSLAESFKIHGIQKASGWYISQSSVGDASGITFTITSAGQIQYVSSTYAGFVSATIKFRALTTSV